MVYGEERLHRLRAVPRGDLYSGTLRDGNHKPTIPSAGASGLNLSTHHDAVVSGTLTGGWARRNSVWVVVSANLRRICRYIYELREYNAM